VNSIISYNYSRVGFFSGGSRVHSVPAVEKILFEGKTAPWVFVSSYVPVCTWVRTDLPFKDRYDHDKKDAAKKIRSMAEN
jgi:hypothetical protein